MTAQPDARPAIGARTLVLTASAMAAFAGNSLLCRMALADGHIAPAAFAAIRTVSGAAMLALFLALRKGGTKRLSADWRAVATLAAYMICFSFAYVELGAASGALILFGAVQFTMFAVSLSAGERFSPLAWVGFASALAGFAFYLAPGLTAPPLVSAILMAAAGAAWGAYSLLGRNAADPLSATAGNFIFAAPIVLLATLISLDDLRISLLGLGLALASGVVTSACGYVIWYAALRGLTGGQAATVQLSVPIITAAAAAVLLSEPLSLRYGLAALATLGGVAIVLAQRSRT